MTNIANVTYVENLLPDVIDSLNELTESQVEGQLVARRRRLVNTLTQWAERLDVLEAESNNNVEGIAEDRALFEAATVVARLVPMSLYDVSTVVGKALTQALREFWEKAHPVSGRAPDPDPAFMERLQALAMQRTETLDEVRRELTRDYPELLVSQRGTGSVTWEPKVAVDPTAWVTDCGVLVARKAPANPFVCRQPRGHVGDHLPNGLCTVMYADGRFCTGVYGHTRPHDVP